MQTSSSRTPWRQLAGGLIALIVLVFAVFAVLFFAQPGGLHGATMRVYATSDGAHGIMKGSEVWLDGRKIGLVKGVTFLSFNADTTDRVLIEMEISRRFASVLRRDALAQIRSGYSLIGADVVAFTGGSPGAAGVHDDDTLHSAPGSDFENVSSQFGLASREFPVIINNMKVIATGLHGAGVIGAMQSDQGTQQMSLVLNRVTSLGAKVGAVNGTVGGVLHGDLMSRAQHAMAAADSVRQLLADTATSFGRFHRDSTLLIAVKDVRNELSITQALMKSPNGTIGRFGADSAIAVGLARAQAQMTALMQDMQRHPFHYFAF